MQRISTAELAEELIIFLDITDNKEKLTLNRRVRSIADYAYSYTHRKKEYNENEELMVERNIADILIDYIINMHADDTTSTNNGGEVDRDIVSIKDGNSQINYKNTSSAKGTFYVSENYKDLELLLDAYRVINYMPVSEELFQ